jgi:hypothetical protein
MNFWLYLVQIALQGLQKITSAAGLNNLRLKELYVNGNHFLGSEQSNLTRTRILGHTAAEATYTMT